MSKVAAQIKVMPENPEIELDDLEERLADSLPESAEINGFGRDDVAFGLVALLPTVIVADGAGGTEPVEEAFASVDGVESVEIQETGRL